MLSDKQISDLAVSTTNAFKGDLATLEAAIGAMYVGKAFGWKVLYLAHEKRTLRKYEGILGISFRDDFPEAGPQAHRSAAYQAVQKIQNFWKAVKGEIKGVRTSLVE